MATTVHLEFNPQSEIKAGAAVKLVGLQKASYLNGRVGIVHGEKNSQTGRFQINLEGTYTSPSTGLKVSDIMLLKQSNLELVNETQSCSGCLKGFAVKDLRKCSKCKMVRYCSTDCQRNDWKKQHKKDCEFYLLSRQSAKKNAGSNNENNDDLIQSSNLSRSDRIFTINTRAMKYVQKGDWANAERDYRYLLEKENFHVIGTYVNLSACLISNGMRVQEAIPLLEEAITLKPLEGPNELAIAYSTLGNAYRMNNQRSKAIETYKNGLSKFPGDPDLTRMLAQVM